MRVEIDLILKVDHLQRPDVVFDQGEGHDEGSESSMVVVDDAPELISFDLGELMAEVSDQVVQYVDMFANRRLDPERRHELGTVPRREVGWSVPRGIRDEPAERLIVLTMVREQEVFVPGVERYDGPSRHTLP